MKTTFIIMMLLVSSITLSQNSFYIGLGIDNKMAIEGPHGGGGVLNPEIFFGFRIEDNARIWVAYEYLKQIEYQKYTFIAGDYIFNFSDRFNAKLGIEWSVISRHMTNPNYYKYGYHVDNLSYGLNGEFEYKLLSNLSIYINSNVFKAEPNDNLGNPMKDTRWDVRSGIIVYLN